MFTFLPDILSWICCAPHWILRVIMNLFLFAKFNAKRSYHKSLLVFQFLRPEKRTKWTIKQSQFVEMLHQSWNAINFCYGANLGQCQSAAGGSSDLGSNWFGCYTGGDWQSETFYWIFLCFINCYINHENWMLNSIPEHGAFGGVRAKIKTD